ncbi:MAG TPA: hypothetical protein VMS21_01570, partial [Methylomirabilota bacterium]|nr:hypothetical protein [Methylomirabilota bacterium]
MTHAISGSTSEFSPLTVLPNFIGLELKHAAPPVERDLPLDQSNAVAQGFTLRAFGGPVLVRSIRFQATGSADEPSAIAGLSLYRSREDEEPRLLVGPRLAGSDDGLIFFTQIDA